jgi:hypothetical protein
MGMKYGTYSTTGPTPLASFSKDYRRAEDGRVLRSVTKVTLNGTLVNTAPPPDTGAGDIVNKKEELEEAFKEQGCAFSLDCGGSPSGPARVLSVSFQNSSTNWVNSVGYTIELEYDDNVGDIAGAENLETLSDEWQVEPLEKSTYSFTTGAGQEGTTAFKVTHTVSAKGHLTYTDCSTYAKEPWEWAKEWCDIAIQTTDAPFDIGTGALNHFRSQAVQKYAGTYNINDNWIVLKGGFGSPLDIFEDFTVDISQQYSTSVATVSIQGSVQGLETCSYTGDTMSKSVSRDKYTAASSAFSTISTKAFDRCVQGLTNAGITLCPTINPLQVNRTVGHNPPQGVITYNYTYTNKPTPCTIPEALSESITMGINYPTNTVAMIVILGRAAGPLMQSMGTCSAYTYSVGVDLTMPITCPIVCTFGGGPANDRMTTYINNIEAALTPGNQIAKTADNVTWNPQEGKYIRNATWAVTPCT